jgi:radical SAM protein with 4Fe4S-binding SPASM domain
MLASSDSNMTYVQARLAKAKIKMLQLDVFGFCNAKCWYCPVRYIPQPEEGKVQMPLETIEKIFKQFEEERDKEEGVVDQSFGLFMTTHYSEILLYKDLPGLLELARKYKFHTYVLSNGTNLTKEKVDLFREYPDVVRQIGLNIPAFEKELWSKRAGFPERRFDELVANLKYAEETLYGFIELLMFVNGVNTEDFNGRTTKGPKFDELGIDLDIENGEWKTQHSIAVEMFPKFHVTTGGLMDRTGLLSDYISNQEMQERRMETRIVAGCSNWGDRTTEWLHINAAGDVILCCNDYNFDYKFGNINTQTIREIWGSDAHVATVERAYREICVNCTAALII